MNIICIPFAYEEKNGSVNIRHNPSHGIIGDYLRNVCVACVTAKRYNPACRVLFATNLNNNELDVEIRQVLENAGIEILHVPYSDFVFDASYPWSLAFYKLCVLKHICELEYDCCCYMDSDVVIQGSFDTLWEECSQHIMLYDTCHGLYDKGNSELWREIEEFLGKDVKLTHYGGEFFAAGKENARAFLAEANQVYESMIQKKYRTTRGDEFIVAVVAYNLGALIKNAGPYVTRIWTTVRHRRVSDCYKNEEMVVLHLPSEKQKGMLKLYRRYIAKGRIPNRMAVHRICHLTNRGFIGCMKWIASLLIRR